MARRTLSTHVTYCIENRIREQMQSVDGKLLFNPVVTALSSPSGKILQICTHIPWASLDAQQFVSKSPLSYYTVTTAKFAAAIPYHVAFSRPNEGIWKEELISFGFCPWKPWRKLTQIPQEKKKSHKIATSCSPPWTILPIMSLRHSIDPSNVKRGVIHNSW
jgi:hypothetical protein